MHIYAADHTPTCPKATSGPVDPTSLDGFGLALRQVLDGFLVQLQFFDFGLLLSGLPGSHGTVPPSPIYTPAGKAPMGWLSPPEVGPVVLDGSGPAIRPAGNRTSGSGTSWFEGSR